MLCWGGSPYISPPIPIGNRYDLGEATHINQTVVKILPIRMLVCGQYVVRFSGHIVGFHRYQIGLIYTNSVSRYNIVFAEQ